MMALRMEGGRICPARVALAAVLGSAIAFGTHAANLAHAHKALLALPAAALLLLIARGSWKGTRAFVHGGLLTVFSAGFLGGVIAALYGATGSLALANMAGGVTAAAVFVAAARENRAQQGRVILYVACTWRGLRIRLRAMADTGNTLRDYMTHRPVIVVSSGAVKPFCAAGLRMRPIFADTAGGRVMMGLFVPEETEICAAGAQCRVQAAVAVSDGLPDGAPALVPPELLGGIQR